MSLMNPRLLSRPSGLVTMTVLTTSVLFVSPTFGNVLLWMMGAITLVSVALPAWRKTILQLVTAMLVGSCLCMALALVLDRFDIRYVWLYSSQALPLYLKVANVWGGDEGTVLLLVIFCMPAALRIADAKGIEGRLAPIIPAWYILTLAFLGPFSLTPIAWQQAQTSQGMNAHLQTFWMAFHAPLVLLAYAWALAPLPSAIAALSSGSESYRAVVVRDSRRAWWVLTAGIGFGMVWALEDFTFGQLWHWDPVQTSAFILWSLLSAVLHGVRLWKRDGTFAQALPLISLLLGVCTFLAMSITRSEVLASSHRYIGTTSWMSHLMLATVLGLVTLVLMLRGRAYPQSVKQPVSLGTLLSVYGFVFAALIAGFGLAQAHWFAFLEAPKPSNLKPFFETLSNWASAGEMNGLRQAFARWDVDGHSLGRWMLPVCVLLGLGGCHVFIGKTLRRRAARFFTLVAACTVATVYWRGGVLTDAYEGKGVLSQSIVSMLPLIDAVLVAGAFLLLASLLWCITSVLRSRTLGAFRLTGSLALIHGGATVALVGGLAATVLNSYAPLLVPPTDDPGKWHRVSADMELRVLPEAHATDFSGYKAVAMVEMRKGDEVFAGQALFQDARQLPPGYQGPVRQLCELLDYRYARHAGDKGYLLHPFIIRGWGADVQIWLPASPRLMQAVTEGAPTAQTLMVVRRYPLVSFVWLGLVAMLVGMLFVPARSARLTK